MVTTTVLQWPITDLATRMWKNPWVIARRVFQFPTETHIRLGDLKLGVFHSTFGAVPYGDLGGFIGGDREARGGA